MPYVINSLAPYATVDVHNSAPHLHAHSRISGNPAGALLPSPNTVAYNLAPTQLHNFDGISLPKESNSIGGQPYPDWVIDNKLTYSWDLCNAIRQELIERGKPHDFEAVKARVVQMMHSPSTAAPNIPPKQLQSFGNSLPEESNSVGGQSNEDWVEVGRKKFKDSIAAMFAEFRQEQAALRMKERKNNDSDKKRDSVIEKAESSNLCVESIQEKEDDKTLESHPKL